LLGEPLKLNVRPALLDQKMKTMRFLFMAGLLFGLQVMPQCVKALVQDFDRNEMYLVKRIYVNEMGNSEESPRFRLLLKRKIAAKGFVIVNTPKVADAILTGAISAYIARDCDLYCRTIEVKLSLKSTTGQILTSAEYTTGRDKGFHSKDGVQRTADDFVNSLRKQWDWSLKASRAGQVEYVFAVWKPNDKELFVSSDVPTDYRLTDEELLKLKSLGLKGELKVAHVGVSGSGAFKTRIIVVLHEQVTEPVDFPLPHQSNLIVVQKGDEWIIEPSYTRFSESNFKIFPITHNQTGFGLDRKNLGYGFQFAYTW
jgi:hypothetical protein